MISWPTNATNPSPNPDPDPNRNPNQVLVHYAIAIGVSLLGVTFVVGHVMEVCTLTP